jgi:hypothetical protein
VPYGVLIICGEARSIVVTSKYPLSVSNTGAFGSLGSCT